ncbi:MAG: glycoside hydrolase family 3 C-terminal domain-containing protein [Clostridia bacterium]|nr:glycoside hydrolase family 3 C-terminal domain-containing protein [Clostridia bacterium]
MLDPTVLARSKALVAEMTVKERMEQLRYEAPAIPRLGVPAYNWWNEALHGVARAGQATVFPQAIAMAASFDDGLLYEVATAISDEARAKYNEYKKQGFTGWYQGLTMWSPNINLFRDPRWGRGHETYGEDPYLTGRMGAAFIRGLQGDHPKYRKTDATMKHYAVHSGPEKERHTFDAVVDDEDLYDSYLYAFRYCIDHAGPAAVMGAYNRVGGEACCASETLLQRILREEFGFEGYVVSDCGAVSDICNTHHITDTMAEAAALAVKNGCDLNCGTAYVALEEAYKQGLISEEAITTAAERLFYARMKLGMFDDDCPYDAISYDCVESEAHRALSLKMAEESIVLLKNDGILPLKAGQKVAVIGPNAEEVSVLLANYSGYPTRKTTILDGILKAVEAEGGQVRYAKGCETVRFYYERPLYEAVSAAKWADVVILVLGLTPAYEGEEGDDYNGYDSGDRVALSLPEVQKELANVVLAEGKPTVLVNVSGSTTNPEEAGEKANAFLQCFYPGAEGGTALANILFGKTSPSGRLPLTCYRSVDDLPPFEDYAMKGHTYRFFEGEPLYPFGYGLTYADIAEEWLSETEVKVTNRSDFAADYSVLCFEKKVPHALCDFKHLRLEGGQTVTVSFEKFR